MCEKNLYYDDSHLFLCNSIKYGLQWEAFSAARADGEQTCPIRAAACIVQWAACLAFS